MSVAGKHGHLSIPKRRRRPLWHYYLGFRRYAKALRKSPRIAYVGDQGSMNLGDEALFNVMQALFPEFGIYPYRGIGRDARVESLVRGRMFVSCLGGGTLIGKPLYLPPVRQILARQLPAFSIGTGVIDPGFWAPVPLGLRSSVMSGSDRRDLSKK